MQHFVNTADQKQANTSRAGMDCGKLTLFLLLQTLKRGVASQDIVYLPLCFAIMGSLCNRNNMFFMGIVHQRHNNWLHLLIARVLFVRLSCSKVHDIPESFFVTYHQETIVKSSQLLQNMVLNTHRVVRLGYYHHR